MSGWFLGGWTAGTTLALFWLENLILTVFLAARVAAHWTATRKRGHENGFLKNFLIVSLVFTVAHGVFLAFILGRLLPDSVNRADVIAGAQWMLGTQAASLVLDLRFLGRWPFAEIRAPADWMLGRVLLVHITILVGMFLYAAMDQPWWFFSVFVGLKALLDIGSLVPQWKPKEAPPWLARGLDRLRPAHDQEPFAEYWRRESMREAEKHAREEEVLEDA